MYFPEASSPYYRVTVFSNYSPFNTPGPDHWSLMAEVCERSGEPADGDTLLHRTVDAMRRDGLVGADARVVSRWHRRLAHGYPIPLLGGTRPSPRSCPSSRSAASTLAAASAAGSTRSLTRITASCR